MKEWGKIKEIMNGKKEKWKLYKIITEEERRTRWREGKGESKRGEGRREGNTKEEMEEEKKGGIRSLRWPD